MEFPIRRVIEGFYGRPWTWAERIEVARSCAAPAMTHYVYAPKDDPLHRHHWRQPYGVDDLDGFTSLAAEGALALGFALSPGLDIRAGDPDDQAELAAKVDQVVAVGASLVVIAYDDLPLRSDVSPARRGADHAEVTNRVVDHLAGRATVALVPTDYTGTTSTPYLDAVATALAPDVPVGWTGRFVVNDTITGSDAQARADALGGRPPLLWDNYPVNDAFMTDRLFLGPLRGRDPALAERCSGYLANAMVQPRCNALPLTATAAFCRGEDPEAAWRAAAEESGLTTFAEACDGGRPVSLVAALADAERGHGDSNADVDGRSRQAVAALRRWLERAATASAPGLEGEADGWVRQVAAEANVGLAALRLLDAARAGDGASVAAESVMLGLTWPKLRRDGHTVMGPRLSVRPVFDQDSNGDWVFHRASVTEDGNAIDRLVRLALDVASSESGQPGRPARPER